MRQLLTDRRGNPIFESFQQRRLRRIILRNAQGGFSSTLLFFVQNRSWEDVIRRSKSHPHEVTAQDRATGNTPLHVACRFDPPTNVVVALQASSRVRNREGATPLHIAASHRCSAEAVRTLIQAAASLSNQEQRDDEEEEDGENDEVSGRGVHPTAVLSRMGRAPIHYACMSFRGLQHDAFCVLFEESLKSGNLRLAPQEASMYDIEDDLDDTKGDENFLDKEYENYRAKSTGEDDNDSFYENGATKDEDGFTVVNVLGMKDATGQTPLGLLFRRYRERVRLVISRIDRMRLEHNHRANSVRRNRAALVAALTVQGDLGELWERARWIVARLTEARLEREGAARREMTSAGDASPTNLGSPRVPTPPPEAAVAADWAAEQYRRRNSSSVQENGRRPVDIGIVIPTSTTVASPTNGDGIVDNNGSSATATATDSAPSSACKFRIVHASVGLTGYGCPPEMIRLAISVHPHQVQEMDEDGNLPIHIAVSAASHLSHASEAFCEANMMALAAVADASSPADDMSVLSDAMSFFSTATISQTTNPFDKVIKILLQHYPEASQIPQGKSGRLPLVMAIESGRRTWDDGIRTLVNSYPPALHNKKIMTERKVYPKVLSRVTMSEEAEGRHRHPTSTGNGVLPRDIALPLGSSSSSSLRPLARTSATASRRLASSKVLRREACARTTVFELLRTKPEWLVNEEDEGKEKKEE